MPDHPTSVRLTQMWAAVERESAGRVHVDFYPSSTLGGEAAMLSQVRLGALDFYITSPGTLDSVISSADLVNIGFVFKDSNEALRAMDGPAGAYVRSEAAAKKLYLLRAIWNGGMREIG